MYRACSKNCASICNCSPSSVQIDPTYNTAHRQTPIRHNSNSCHCRLGNQEIFWKKRNKYNQVKWHWLLKLSSVQSRVLTSFFVTSKSRPISSVLMRPAFINFSNSTCKIVGQEVRTKFEAFETALLSTPKKSSHVKHWSLWNIGDGVNNLLSKILLFPSIEFQWTLGPNCVLCTNDGEYRKKAESLFQQLHYCWTALEKHWLTFFFFLFSGYVSLNMRCHLYLNIENKVCHCKQLPKTEKRR